MKFEDIAKQLPNKRRTLNDLARFIKTKSDDVPNYSLFLGAGCSITSGIRSAEKLIKIWRKEICESLPDVDGYSKDTESDQIEYLKDWCSDWYDPNKEYSSLFERRYDLQRQRRMFVESEVANKLPSIGYAYLTSLVAKGYFRTIFTTNFDDLINEAFYLYSNDRPIVCAHDSSINSVTVTSKRPKIIKLHGDYLFDDIKATLKETESLELNMKSKFAEFSKEAGLVVVGYSGSDRSIMDVLHGILKSDDYMRSGIYWCLRPDSEIPEELRRLFWKDRVYFVEIPGFDELFAEFYSIFNDGDVLPDSTIISSKRPNLLAEKLLNSDGAVPNTTDVLKKARSALERLLKKSTIANMLIKSDGDERLAVQGRVQDLTDDELMLMTQVDNLIAEGKLEQSIAIMRTSLVSELRLDFKRKIQNNLVKAYRLIDDNSQALAVTDELIQSNSLLAANYILKSRILCKFEDKERILKEGLDREPYSSYCHYVLGDLYKKWSSSEFGEKKKRYLELALEHFNNSLSINPSLLNEAWSGKYNTITKIVEKADKTKLKELVDELNSKNPFSYWAIQLTGDFIVTSKQREIASELLSRLDDIEDRYGIEDANWTIPIRLSIHKTFNEIEKIKSCIDAFLSKVNISRYPGTAARISRYLRECLRDENRSQQILEASLSELDFDSSVLESLACLYRETGQLEQAEELDRKWGYRIIESARIEMKIDLAVARGEFNSALRLHQDWTRKSGTKDATTETYLLINAGLNKEAEDISRKYLELCDYSVKESVLIVNHELAKKNRGGKVNANRLTKILDFAENEVSAAIYCLLDKPSDAILKSKIAFEENKRFIYNVMRWPAFKEIIKRKDFWGALGVSMPETTQ